MSLFSRLTRSGRTATADGLGTGKIQAGTEFVQVTSSNADHIITLTAPILGRVILLRNGATGYELRSNDPEEVSINGGLGADAESAIAAEMFVVCIVDTETSWLCTQTAEDGTASPVEAAA